jgi:hypothetical protein
VKNATGIDKDFSDGFAGLHALLQGSGRVTVSFLRALGAVLKHKVLSWLARTYQAILSNSFEELVDC